MPAATVPAISTGSLLLPGEQLRASMLLDADAAMWAVILAGGIGSRFWPLSSPQRPKQLLRLLGDRPLISDTVSRLQPGVTPERTLILTSADIAAAIRGAVPEVPEWNVLVEPGPLGTAAAVAWGAQEIARRAEPQTIACVMHADLAVAFPDSFHHSLRVAGGAAARDDVVAMIGVLPTRPETGFGYILPAEALHPDWPLERGGLAAVSSFTEKPRSHGARSLVAAGALWHSGISVWRAAVMLECIRESTPEVAPALGALRAGKNEVFFNAVRPISIERGLFERCRSLVVTQGDFGWDDVGTWASLKRCRELDDSGNGLVGDVHFADSHGNIVHAEGASVALYGVDGLVVVSLPGITFVTSAERAADLKALLEQLPPRPWPGESQARGGGGEHPGRPEKPEAGRSS
ncbi:MAG: mannose-1-phosphate guanylyltransferase [Gemmatimonadota bacterium]